MKKKKNFYQKPTTKFVKVRQQRHILAGSQDPPKRRGDVEDYIVVEERYW